MKDIKIMFQLPADYFMGKDELDILSSYSGRFRDAFHNRLVDSMIEKALKEIIVPKIEITAKEIKDRMLTILAERALSEKDGT